MSYSKVILEKGDGIGTIILNDPENLNVIDSPIIVDDLDRGLDELSADPEVRVIVIKGAGDVFSAGGDLNQMKKAFAEGGFNYGISARRLAIIVNKLRNIRKPIIASIHGAVIGGALGLVLACDFRIATENTKFIFAFSKIGLVTDLGASYTLAKIVGPAKATELLMTAKLFNGKEAYQYGLVNEAVLPEELESATRKLALTLAQGPPLAYGAIKTLINRASYGGLDVQLDIEAEYQELLQGTHDHKEGVSAFLEKRKPNYKGC